MLQLQFDPKQEYQLQAVESIVRLFEGLPPTAAGDILGDETVPNLPPFEDLDENWLLDNLNAVQEDNGIEPSPALDMDEGLVLEGAGDEAHRSPHFTVEMETGTGKTYVYLRTIYELRKRLGWGKFIIVVPSVAIYEGVCKNFDITREHFRALYGNETVNLIRYDGAQLSRLRTFATSTFCEVMVMTLDSFNKISNVVYKPTEKLPGELKPFEFIQQTRPVVILDEPQNMGSDKSKQALRTLHPLVTLRFSATHRENPNLVYRLTPFDAFRLGLVKKIEVLGVTERENVNQITDAPLLALQGVTGSGAALRAQVLVFARGTSGTKEATLTLRRNDDLGLKTKRAEYAGYVVETISIEGGTPTVEFSNGVCLGPGGLGLSRPELFRVQIEKTVEQHLRRQEELRARGIKVLSLFFIDRVANFTASDGLIRLLFDQAFDKLKKGYPQWKDQRAENVRSAYFAQKKAKTGDAESIDTEGRNASERDAEKAAFQLIMRDKEKLLSLDEPVSFLFAHSALREGWDNPNVFQICTLNQTVSTMRKRQEIGRGLRLCVDQSGARVPADEVNTLTVIANSAYKDYADNLQKEYEEDGLSAPPPPSDARKADAHRNDKIFKSTAFRDLWTRLSRPTDYAFNLDTDALIEECGNRLNGKTFTAPVIVVERGRFVQTRLALQLDRILDNGKAKVRVTVEDTQGDEREVAVTVKEGEDLKTKTGEDRLRGFRVTNISGSGDDATLTFGNDITLTPHDVYRTDGADGFKPAERFQMAPREAFPVPDLLARAARETGLTRPTLNRIFKALRPEKAEFLLRNPEGFIATFIAEVNNALADHIAERITFSSSGGNGGGGDEERLEALFPATKKFTQRELHDAGARGLYDQVQTDSGVEISFVEMVRDDTQLVFYFKFPPAFKVALPKQIGNYNPDWGLGRLSEDGITLHYIRETKGSTDIAKLQWSHEKRKIECARKYFEALGLDYRPVTGKIADWWQPWQVTGKL